MSETAGQRIKRLREERRWSQRDLAAKLGMSSKTISNWERDQHIPRASLGALEKLFNEPLTEDDPVEAAIRLSPLAPFRQTKVIAYYQEQLYDQERDPSLSESLKRIKQSQRRDVDGSPKKRA